MQQHLMPLHSSIFLLTLETPDVTWSFPFYVLTNTLLSVSQTEFLTVENYDSVVTNICRTIV